MSPAGVACDTQRLEDGLLTVFVRALVWALGIVAGTVLLWFASNIIAPMPATAATREVNLVAGAAPLAASGPPLPQPAGLVAAPDDGAGNTASGSSSGSAPQVDEMTSAAESAPEESSGASAPQVDEMTSADPPDQPAGGDSGDDSGGGSAPQVDEMTSADPPDQPADDGGESGGGGSAPKVDEMTSADPPAQPADNGDDSGDSGGDESGGGDEDAGDGSAPEVDEMTSADDSTPEESDGGADDSAPEESDGGADDDGRADPGTIPGLAPLNEGPDVEVIDNELDAPVTEPGGEATEEAPVGTEANPGPYTSDVDHGHGQGANGMFYDPDTANRLVAHSSPKSAEDREEEGRRWTQYLYDQGTLDIEPGEVQAGCSGGVTSEGCYSRTVDENGNITSEHDTRLVPVDGSASDEDIDAGQEGVSAGSVPGGPEAPSQLGVAHPGPDGDYTGSLTGPGSVDLDIDPAAGEVDLGYTGDGALGTPQNQQVDTNNGGSITRDGFDAPTTITGGGSGTLADEHGTEAALTGTGPDGTEGTTVFADAPGDVPTTVDTEGTEHVTVTTPVEDVGEDRFEIGSGLADPIGLRGADGTPVDALCGDCEFFSAEGDHAVARPAGTVDIDGRDSDGYGGQIVVAGDATSNTAENTILTCQGCATGTQTLPTAPGDGGTATCSVTASGGSCSGLGAPTGPGGQRDMNFAAVDEGGTSEFTQFLRHADGTGGGSFGRTTGDGSSYQKDAYGHWIQANGEGARTGLLYAEGDGYLGGQSCVAAPGRCTGSEPVDRRLGWVEPSPEALRELGVVEPGTGRPSPDFVGPVSETPSDSPIDRDRIVLDHLQSESHLRWTGEDGRDRVLPAILAADAIEAEGATPENVEAFHTAFDAVDETTWERLGRTEGELARLAEIDDAVRDVLSDADVEARLAGDPDLVAELNPDYDPSTPVTEADIERAAQTVRDLQQQSATAATSAGVTDERSAILDADFAAWQAEADAFEATGVGDVDALNRRLDELKAEGTAIDALRNPFLDRYEEAQRALRTFDGAFAGAANDPGYAETLAAAGGDLESLSGALDRFPAPTPDEVALYEDLVTLAGTTGSGYQAALAGPRSPDSALGDLRLPSTGAPDTALALDSAARLPYFGGLAASPDTPLVNEDGSPLSPDQVAALAAYTPVPRTAEEAADLVGGAEGSPERDAALAEYFRPWNVQNGSYNALSAGLSPEEQARLGEMADEAAPPSVPGFLGYFGDGFAHTLAQGDIAARAVDDFSRDSATWLRGQFGLSPVPGPADPTFDANLNRDLNNAVAHAPAGLYDLGSKLVTQEVTNEFDRLVNPDAFAQRPGESDGEYGARMNPFNNVFVEAWRNGEARWWPGITEGDWSQRDTDYYERPVTSALEDTLVPGIASGGASLALRSGARGAALTGNTAGRLGLRALELPMRVQVAPLLPYFAAGRGLARGAAPVVAGTARLTGNAATGATARGVQGFADGSPTASAWAAAGDGLARATPRLEGAARNLGVIGEAGIRGLAPAAPVAGPRTSDAAAAAPEVSRAATEPAVAAADGAGPPAGVGAAPEGMPFRPDDLSGPARHAGDRSGTDPPVDAAASLPLFRGFDDPALRAARDDVEAGVAGLVDNGRTGRARDLDVEARLIAQLDEIQARSPNIEVQAWAESTRAALPLEWQRGVLDGNLTRPAVIETPARAAPEPAASFGSRALGAGQWFATKRLVPAVIAARAFFPDTVPVSLPEPTPIIATADAATTVSRLGDEVTTRSASEPSPQNPLIDRVADPIAYDRRWHPEDPATTVGTAPIFAGVRTHLQTARHAEALRQRDALVASLDAQLLQEQESLRSVVDGLDLADPLQAATAADSAADLTRIAAQRDILAAPPTADGLSLFGGVAPALPDARGVEQRPVDLAENPAFDGAQVAVAGALARNLGMGVDDLQAALDGDPEFRFVEGPDDGGVVIRLRHPALNAQMDAGEQQESGADGEAEAAPGGEVDGARPASRPNLVPVNLPVAPAGAPAAGAAASGIGSGGTSGDGAATTPTDADAQALPANGGVVGTNVQASTPPNGLPQARGPPSLGRASEGLSGHRASQIEAPTGHLIRLDGERATPDELRVLGEAIQQGRTSAILPPAELMALSGMEEFAFSFDGCQGLCAIDGFNDIVRAGGVPGRPVLYGHSDGTIYTDTRMLAALQAGRLGEVAPVGAPFPPLTLLFARAMGFRQDDEPATIASKLAPLADVVGPESAQYPAWQPQGAYPVREADGPLDPTATQPDLVTLFGLERRLAPLRERMRAVDAEIAQATIALVHIDPRAPADTTVRLLDRLTELRAEASGLQVRDELLRGPPAGLRVAEWDALPDEVREGFTAAYWMLAQSGLVEKLLGGPSAGVQDVTLASATEFERLYRGNPANAGRDLPTAFARIGGGIVLRADSFRPAASDPLVRNAQLISSAGLLLHEWAHAVDSPIHSGRATERKAWMIQNHFVRAQLARLALHGAQAADRARLEAIAHAWQEILAGWTPSQRPLATYPLPSGYDDIALGSEGAQRSAPRDGPGAFDPYDVIPTEARLRYEADQRRRAEDELLRAQQLEQRRIVGAQQAEQALGAAEAAVAGVPAGAGTVELGAALREALARRAFAARVAPAWNNRQQARTDLLSDAIDGLAARLWAGLADDATRVAALPAEHQGPALAGLVEPLRTGALAWTVRRAPGALAGVGDPAGAALVEQMGAVAEVLGRLQAAGPGALGAELDRLGQQEREFHRENDAVVAPEVAPRVADAVTARGGWAPAAELAAGLGEREQAVRAAAAGSDHMTTSNGGLVAVVPPGFLATAHPRAASQPANGVELVARDGTAFPVRNQQAFLGTDPAADLVLPYDPASPARPVLLQRADGWAIADAARGGAVTVDGRPVTTWAPLQSGDRLRIDGAVFDFRAPPGPGGARPTWPSEGPTGPGAPGRQGSDWVRPGVLPPTGPTVAGSGAAGARGSGGAVAIGGFDAVAREQFVAQLDVLISQTRSYFDVNFPHLARGPPGAENVPIFFIDASLADGQLIAVGARTVHFPHGVIVVPAPVASAVNNLIRAGLLAADWWTRLLDHELRFHILGHEHSGPRHDGHAAALVDEVLAALARRGEPAAPSDTGRGAPPAALRGPDRTTAALDPARATTIGRDATDDVILPADNRVSRPVAAVAVAAVATVGGAGAAVVIAVVVAAALTAVAVTAYYGFRALTRYLLPQGRAPPRATSAASDGPLAVDETGAPLPLSDWQRDAAGQWIRRTMTDQPGRVVEVRTSDPAYRQADPEGVWAREGVPVVAILGLRQAFDLAKRFPGRPRISLLYYATTDPSGRRILAVDPAVLRVNEHVAAMDRALIAARELLRHQGASEARVRAAPLPDPLVLQFLAGRTTPAMTAAVLGVDENTLLDRARRTVDEVSALLDIRNPPSATELARAEFLLDTVRVFEGLASRWGRPESSATLQRDIVELRYRTAQRHGELGAGEIERAMVGGLVLSYLADSHPSDSEPSVGRLATILGADVSALSLLLADQPHLLLRAERVVAQATVRTLGPDRRPVSDEDRSAAAVLVELYDTRSRIDVARDVLSRVRAADLVVKMLDDERVGLDRLADLIARHAARGWTVPALWAPRLEEMRRELDQMARAAALFAQYPLSVPPSAAFWAAAWAELAALAANPRHPVRETLLHLLARAVGQPFADAQDPGWTFLSTPGWLATALTTTEGTAPAWLDRHWSTARQRDRLALGVLAAATGSADWLAELPKKRRSQRELTDLIQLWTDPVLEPYRAPLSRILTEIPGSGGHTDRAQFMGSWVDLVHEVVRGDPLVRDLDRVDRTLRILGALSRTLTAIRGPPDRAATIDRATAALQRALVRRIGTLLGANLDPTRPLTLRPGTDLWRATVGYLPVAHPALVPLLARYVEVWQRTGDGSAARAAFWAARRAQLTAEHAHSGVLQHELAPQDIARTIPPTDPTGSAVEVLVGASTDPIEALHLGHPNVNGSCLDCVIGEYRSHAQRYVLHPEVVVLYAWRRDAQGGRGERLARLAALVTDQGILPVSPPQSSAGLDLDAAFGDYLRAWAEKTGRPLIRLAEKNTWYEPERIRLPAPSALVGLRIAIPDPQLPDAPAIWFDAFDGPQGMPAEITRAVERWTVGAPGRTGGSPGAGGDAGTGPVDAGLDEDASPGRSAATGADTTATTVENPGRGPPRSLASRVADGLRGALGAGRALVAWATATPLRRWITAGVVAAVAAGLWWLTGNPAGPAMMMAAAPLGGLGEQQPARRAPGPVRRALAAVLLTVATLPGVGVLATVLAAPAHAAPPAPGRAAVDAPLAPGAATLGQAELPAGTAVEVAPAAQPVPGREITAAGNDTAGRVADGFGVGFDELDAANDGRFTGPEQRIGGETVRAPATWSGVWTTQRGDSYWRIYIERFDDPAGYQAAVAVDGTPNLIHPLDEYRVQAAPAAPPVTPGAPTTPTTPGAPTAPTTTVPPPGTGAGPLPPGVEPALVGSLGIVGVLLANVVADVLIRWQYALSKQAGRRIAVRGALVVGEITVIEVLVRYSPLATVPIVGPVLLGLFPAAAVLAWGALNAGKAWRFSGAWLLGSLAVVLFPPGGPPATWGDALSLYGLGLAGVVLVNVVFDLFLALVVAPRRKQVAEQQSLGSGSARGPPGVAGPAVKTRPGEEPDLPASKAQIDRSRLPAPWSERDTSQGALHWLRSVLWRPFYWGITGWTAVYAVTTPLPTLAPSPGWVLPGVVAPAAATAALIAVRLWAWSRSRSDAALARELGARLSTGATLSLTELGMSARRARRVAQAHDTVLAFDEQTAQADGQLRRLPAGDVALARAGADEAGSQRFHRTLLATRAALTKNEQQQGGLTWWERRQLAAIDAAIRRVTPAVYEQLPILQAAWAALTSPGAGTTVDDLATAAGVGAAEVRDAVRSPSSGFVLDGDTVRRPGPADAFVAQVSPGSAPAAWRPARPGTPLSIRAQRRLGRELDELATRWERGGPHLAGLDAAARAAAVAHLRVASRMLRGLPAGIALHDLGLPHLHLEVGEFAPGQEPLDPVTGQPITATAFLEHGVLRLDVSRGNVVGLAVVLDGALTALRGPAAGAVEAEGRAMMLEAAAHGRWVGPRERAALAYLTRRNPDALLGVLDRAARLQRVAPGYARELDELVEDLIAAEVATRFQDDPVILPGERPGGTYDRSGVDLEGVGGRRRDVQAVLQRVGVALHGAVSFMAVARHGQLAPVLVLRSGNALIVGRPDVAVDRTTLTVKAARALGIEDEHLVADPAHDGLFRLRHDLVVEVVGYDGTVTLPGVRVQTDLGINRVGRDLLAGWGGPGGVVVDVGADGRIGSLRRASDGQHGPRTPIPAIEAAFPVRGDPTAGGRLIASVPVEVAVNGEDARGGNAVVNPLLSVTSLSPAFAAVLGLDAELVFNPARGVRRAVPGTVVTLVVDGLTTRVRLDLVRVEEGQTYDLIVGRDALGQLGDTTVLADAIVLTDGPGPAEPGPAATAGAVRRTEAAITAAALVQRATERREAELAAEATALRVAAARWLLAGSPQMTDSAPSRGEVARALGLPADIVDSILLDTRMSALVPTVIGTAAVRDPERRATPLEQAVAAIESADRARERATAAVAAARVESGKAQAAHRAALAAAAQDRDANGPAGPGGPGNPNGPDPGGPAAGAGGTGSGGRGGTGPAAAPGDAAGGATSAPSIRDTASTRPGRVDATGHPIRGPPWWRAWLRPALGAFGVVVGLAVAARLGVDPAAGSAAAGFGALSLRERWPFGPVAALRRADAAHAAPLQDAVVAHREAAAVNRRARDTLLAAAGDDVAPARAALTASNGALRAALAQLYAARETYLAAMSPAARAAVAAGVSNRRIGLVTGLDTQAVGHLTGRFESPDRHALPVVDPLIRAHLRFWAVRHPESTLSTVNGPIDPADLLSLLAREFDDPSVLEDTLLVLGVSHRVAVTIGRQRLTIVDLDDAHYHHIGYDDPAGTDIEGFLRMLADVGHEGVITFHPIPQRGQGPATSGGSFYYALRSVLTQGLVFHRPMLKMWGKFPDVRLMDAIRNLPPDLAWRAVMGVAGARTDIPGAFGYLAAMAVVNPGLAYLIAEHTIQKEAVTDLLGPEATRTLNPAWVTQVRRLVAATALVAEALTAGRLDADDLPAGLHPLLAGQVADPEAAAVDLLPLLLEHVDALRTQLGRAGHSREANDLLTRAEQDALELYNPNLRELLRASEQIGYLTVLHNDFGLARLLGNARFTQGPPDEQFGVPLLSLLREHPGAKVIVAHLGVGKFTDVNADHLDLIRAILDDPGLAHVSFDISWNEVARHLQATRAIQHAFVDLVLDHPTRFVFGSDGVKAESVAQYFRHAHDLEPTFRLIEERAGAETLAKVRGGNLRRLLAAARADVEQWAFDELYSGTWDAYLDTFTAERRQIVSDWLTDQRRAGRPVTPGHVATGSGRFDTEVAADRARYEQMRSLRRWHNAVTPRVVKGQRIRFGLISSAIRARLEDNAHTRADARERAAAARTARHGLTPATTTAGLLSDPAGRPYTVEALVAGHQVGAALGADPGRGWARHVLRETQATQTAQNASLAEIRELRRTLVRRAWLASGVAVVVVGAAGVALWPAVLAAPAAVGYAAFAARGALTVHRSLYVQQMRVLNEAILERGQFNLDTIRRLAAVIRKYAALDRSTADQLARFDAATEQFLVDAYVLLALPPRPDERLTDRNELSVARYSQWTDEVGSALGAQAVSFQGLAPDSGLLGRLVASALAGTFLLNLAGHVTAAVTAAPLGPDMWVNGVYAASDLVFGVQAVHAAITGWAGYDGSARPAMRKLTQYVGFPLVTMANVALTVTLFADGQLVTAAAAAALTGATGWLTVLGATAELRLGRRSPRYGATANVVLGGSLLALGLIGLGSPAAVGAALGVGAVGAAVMWLTSRVDSLRSRRAAGGRWIRGPTAWWLTITSLWRRSGPGSNDGPLAFDVPGYQRRELTEVLPAVPSGVLDPAVLPWTARGPPGTQVRVLAAADLRAAGIHDATIRATVAFTVDGTIYVVDEQVDRLAALPLLGWFDDVVAHEITYRVEGTGTETARAADARALLTDLTVAEKTLTAELGVSRNVLHEAFGVLDAGPAIPALRDVEAALVAARTPDGGLRHIELVGFDEARALTQLRGPVPTAAEAAALAAALAHAEPLPRMHAALDPVLADMVIAAGELVEGRTDGPALTRLLALPGAPRGPPAVVFHRLAAPILDPATGLVVADAGHRWESGVLHVWALDPVGVVHELVEALFAPWLGFTDDAAHVIATLAERAVRGQARHPHLVLPERLYTEIEDLTTAGYGEVFADLVADHEAAQNRLVATVGPGPWRDLALAYLTQLRAEAHGSGGWRQPTHIRLQVVDAPLPGQLALARVSRATARIGATGGAVIVGALALGVPADSATAAGAVAVVLLAYRALRQWWRGLGGGEDGALAVFGLRTGTAARLAAGLRRTRDQAIPLDPAVLPHTPRGPPPLVVPGAALSAAGVPARTLRRLVAYTLDGQTHLTAERVAELAAHRAAGRLPADWLGRVLDHEQHFHTDHHRPRLAHTLDAAGITTRLVWARTLRASAPAGPATTHPVRHRLVAALGTAGLVVLATLGVEHVTGSSPSGFLPLGMLGTGRSGAVVAALAGAAAGAALGVAVGFVPLTLAPLAAALGWILGAHLRPGALVRAARVAGQVVAIGVLTVLLTGATGADPRDVDGVRGFPRTDTLRPTHTSGPEPAVGIAVEVAPAAQPIPVRHTESSEHGARPDLRAVATDLGPTTVTPTARGPPPGQRFRHHVRSPTTIKENQS